MRFTSKEKLVEFLGVARSSRVATAIWHRTCFWISIASSLLELSKSKVKHHARFADRVLKVSDVPAGGENGGRCDIFVVLMGAAGYIQAYSGIRRHPNVVFEAIPNKGPNSSFILHPTVSASRQSTKNELGQVVYRLPERVHSVSL